jgi:hypothetical protein
VARGLQVARQAKVGIEVQRVAILLARNLVPLAAGVREDDKGLILAGLLVEDLDCLLVVGADLGPSATLTDDL